MTVFDEVKQSLDIVEVARDFGVQIVGRNKAHCPFHNDNTPSMSFWSDNKRFTCFGACNMRGDVIDLVGRIENLLPLEAARTLNDTYHLNINFEEPEDKAEQSRRLAQRDRRAELAHWEQDAQRTLNRYVRLMNEWQRVYVPLHPDFPISPRYLEAVGGGRDYADYLLDEMSMRSGNLQKMAEFYMAQREYIEKLWRRLQEETTPYAGRAEKNPEPAARIGAIYLPTADFAVQAL